MIMPLVAGCGEIATKKEDGKLHIVTTVFPYYDFAKQIGGDRVSVDLIVPAGMDTHSFEPTAKDMVTFGEADVFIYNGGTMESWVPKVLEAAEGKNITTLRMMDHVKVVDEEIVEGMLMFFFLHAFGHFFFIQFDGIHHFECFGLALVYGA